jgi:hypothetical protein
MARYVRSVKFRSKLHVIKRLAPDEPDRLMRAAFLAYVRGTHLLRHVHALHICELSGHSDHGGIGANILRDLF